MRESPLGARWDPFISTQVFGAIVGMSPSAFATNVIVGVGGIAGGLIFAMNPSKFPVIAGRKAPAVVGRSGWEV